MQIAVGRSAVVANHFGLVRSRRLPLDLGFSPNSFRPSLCFFEILKLDTRENLRGYIAEYNPKKRNRVHDAIENTILTEPQRFITRNSGFVIGGSQIEVDDNAKVFYLEDASILNGAQSQGEIKRWVEKAFGEERPTDAEDAPFFVRAEIIVDPDSAEVVETAIARNTATPVKSISQAGARGHLDELEASIQNRRPGVKIRKSETDENVYDTRKILQFARLLMPASLSGSDSPAERLRAYKNPEQCLTDFASWSEAKNNGNETARARYDFTIQIAPQAMDEYEFWERNEAWNGHRLWEETKKGGRACRRDKAGKVIWVSPGLVFPIVGAMAEFVEQSATGAWVISKPSLFKPDEMIERAVAQFRTVNSDPMQMGRSAGVYDALRIYPRTLVEVMLLMKQSRN